MTGGSSGILVATDKQIEWMLPWWWHHYSKHNRYPVVFVDLGMTETAKAWCRQRGKLISLECPKNLVVPKDLISRGTDRKLGKNLRREFFGTRENRGLENHLRCFKRLSNAPFGWI